MLGYPEWQFIKIKVGRSGKTEDGVLDIHLSNSSDPSQRIMVRGSRSM